MEEVMLRRLCNIADPMSLTPNRWDELLQAALDLEMWLNSPKPSLVMMERRARINQP